MNCISILMRRRSRYALAGLLFVLIFSERAAVASPCGKEGRTERVGDAMPIRLAMGDAADFGAAQEACPRTSMSLESRASVLVAAKDFYGRLYANASLRGSFVLTDDVWLSIYVPGLEYRFVANATIDAGRTSLGAAALGVHYASGNNPHLRSLCACWLQRKPSFAMRPGLGLNPRSRLRTLGTRVSSLTAILRSQRCSPCNRLAVCWVPWRQARARISSIDPAKPSVLSSAVTFACLMRLICARSFVSTP
jgi:hypothetical protein